jgi:hypothetical protein
VTVRVERSDEDVRLTVENDGPGIPDAHVERLTTPHRQAPTLGVSRSSRRSSRPTAAGSTSAGRPIEGRASRSGFPTPRPRPPSA